MTSPFPVETTAPSDHDTIEQLLDIAFGIDRHVKTSYRLREGSAPAPGLSLVVRDLEIGIAGSISFWPVMVGKAGLPALLLGPIVVHPKRQNIGVGRALMLEGMARARAKGYPLIILVGDAPYYERVGFRKLPEGRLLLPGPVDPDRFMYRELEQGALARYQGLVLPPHRYREISAAFPGPHQARGKQQRGQRQQ